MEAKTLVAIMAHSGANATLQRHWSWYMRAGCPILVIGRTDTDVWHPGEGVAGCLGKINIGVEGYASGTNHLHRLLNLLTYFTVMADLEDFTDICIVEYDSLFFRPLGQHPGGLCTIPGGHSDGSDGFHGTTFYHTPWWVDRETARQIIAYGSRMLLAHLWERGFIDRWLGLMVDLYQLKVTPAPAFSANSLDQAHFMAAARRAVATGVTYVHGVKTQEQLSTLVAEFRSTP